MPLPGGMGNMWPTPWFGQNVYPAETLHAMQQAQQQLQQQQLQQQQCSGAGGSGSGSGGSGSGSGGSGSGGGGIPMDVSSSSTGNMGGMTKMMMPGGGMFGWAYGATGGQYGNDDNQGLDLGLASGQGLGMDGDEDNEEGEEFFDEDDVMDGDYGDI